MNKSSSQAVRRTQKIAVLGAPGTGKTTLVKRLRGLEPYPLTQTDHNTDETPLGIHDDVSLVENLGDIPEAEVREAIKEVKPTIALVVVRQDRERQEHLERNVAEWFGVIQSTDGGYNVPTRFLVGTMSDITSTLDNEGLEELGRTLGFNATFLTSSKTEDGVHALRQTVLDVARANEEKEEDEPGGVAFVVRTLAEELCELIAKHPGVLDEIEWRDLERIVARALEKIGFSVELTPPTKDGGKDVIARCVVESAAKVFYVEIKHWRSGGRPGSKQVSEFIEINARDGTDGGLFLSSSGYSESVHRQLGRISKQNVRLGERDKIISLCQHYVKRRRGVWFPRTPLPELLFEHTLG